MKLFALFNRRSLVVGGASIAAGSLSGVLSAMLIVLINRAIGRPEELGAAVISAFGALVLARLLLGGAAQILGDYLAQYLLASLCRDLTRRMLAVPLPRLEAMGMPRMLATFTDDVVTIVWAVQSVPALALNVAILVACAAYLGWLSWAVFAGVAVFIGCGVGTFLVLVRSARRRWRQLSQQRERLIHHLRAVIDGVKELKLNAARREAFLTSSLGTTLETIRRLGLHSSATQAIASASMQALFFALMGILIFATPSLREGRGEALTAYLLVFVYMMGPFARVIEAWPTVVRGNISVDRVKVLIGELDSAVSAATVSVPATKWERLELKSVVFSYPGEGGSAFRLGPLDFTLQPGEIVFVAGGNGSGKSTFAKVLTGLYPAESGEIRFDGQLVTDETRDWYHGHFSVVFSDFYLFDRLLGIAGPDLDGRARAELTRLELDRKVQVKDGVFSTTALSAGQRKRLALVTALLDDRPLYVLDEWAADQDPHYRDIFYTALLPELRRQGKAVVVISHDDRYYHVGDRTVRLAYGQVVP